MRDDAREIIRRKVRHFRADFGRGFAAHEGFGLGDKVGEEDGVVGGEGGVGAGGGEKVAGDEFGALVDELVKG